MGNYLIVLLFILFFQYSSLEIMELFHLPEYQKPKFSDSKIIYIYINIKNLSLFENGVLSLHSNLLKDDIQFKYKFSNLKPNSESDYTGLEFSNKFYESEIENYFHLYFKKIENKDYIYFQISTFDKISYLELTYSNILIFNLIPYSIYIKELSIPGYVPYYIKYNAPCNWLNFRNLIITSDSDDMILIEGDFIEKYKKSKKSNIQKLLTKNKCKNKDLSFIIKFFNKKSFTYINIHSLTNPIKLKILEKRSEIELINFEITNPYKPAYFIGKYSYKTKDIIWIEPIIGNVRTYYKNSNQINNIFNDTFHNLYPDENSGRKVNKNYVKVYSDLDLFSFFCENYCYFNLYILPSIKRQVGKLFYYFLVSKDEEKNLEIQSFDKSFQTLIKIKNINKKKIDITISNNDKILNNIFLNETNDIGLYKFKEKKNINITIKSFQEESLIIIYKFINNLCTVYTEQILNPTKINKECGIFYLPENKYTYDKYEIKFQNKMTHPSYQFGIEKKGEIIPMNGLLLDKEELENGNKIEIKNPYKQILSKNINPNYRFYIIIYFCKTIEGEEFKNGLTFIYKQNVYKNKLLTRNRPNIVRINKEYRLLPYFESNKKLAIIVVKIGENMMDLELKTNEEVYKTFFLEKKFNIFYIDYNGISTEISFSKKNINDSVFIYYNYVSEKDIEEFQINDNFAVSYSYDEKSNITTIYFNSPYSIKLLRKKKLSVRYYINAFIMKNPNETFNINNINSLKPIKSLISNYSFIKVNLSLNRNYEYKIILTGRARALSMELRPLFLYQTLIIRKKINEYNKNEDKFFQRNFFWIFITIFLCIPLFIIIILYIKISKKEIKVNINHNSYNNLTNIF